MFCHCYNLVILIMPYQQLFRSLSTVDRPIYNKTLVALGSLLIGERRTVYFAPTNVYRCRLYRLGERQLCYHASTRLKPASVLGKDYDYFLLSLLKWGKLIINTPVHECVHHKSAMHHLHHTQLYKIDYCVYLSWMMDCHELDPYTQKPYHK